MARHRLSTPGNPRIDLGHYPGHPQHPDGSPRPPRPRARTAAEEAFLDLGDGAHAWLVEASAVGAARIRAKMDAAVELAAIAGTGTVDEALGVAAAAGRFADGDLAAIIDHRAAGIPPRQMVVADEHRSVQPGTHTWAGFTTGHSSQECTR